MDFKELKTLHDLGLSLIWLHPNSKRPIGTGWTQGPRKTKAELNQAYKKGVNLGVRLGGSSKIGEYYLAAVDIDIKSKDPKHLKEALDAAKKVVGNIEMPQVDTGRGGGSRHLYFLTKEPFKTFNIHTSTDILEVLIPSKKPTMDDLAHFTKAQIDQGLRLSAAWEVSLYSDGRQTVLPPSIHPDTGRAYKWAKQIDPGGKNLTLLDIEKFRPLESTKPKKDKTTPGHKTSLSSEPQEIIKFNLVDGIEISWLGLTPQTEKGIATGEGVSDRSGFLYKAVHELLNSGLNRDEVLSVLTDKENYISSAAFEHAQTQNRERAAAWVYKYTFKKVNSQKDPVSFFKDVPLFSPKELTVEEAKAQEEEILSWLDWRQGLDRNKKGVLGTIRNLNVIFSNILGEGSAPLFKKDIFANRIIYGADSPWGSKKGTLISDIDLIMIKSWLASSEFSTEPPTALIFESILFLSELSSFHPVQDWIKSLKWDGVPRISTWLKDYCEAEAEEPYLTEVSRKFILAMVKRIMEPGCQWDYILVLEGAQGKFKSSTARALAGDSWFLDNLPDLKDKDALVALRGKWLVELGELANIKRSDHSSVKAFLVRRIDSFRSPYARISEDVPRQSVFIGTVNEGEYLKDPTGNRRFWPVKVGECDAKGIAAMREQFFAEAYHILTNGGELLALEGAAKTGAEEAQDERRIDDDEVQMREALIEFLRSEKSENFNFHSFKIKDLMLGSYAPWGEWAQNSYALQTASQVLKTLGFLKKRSNQIRFWELPKTNPYFRENKVNH